MRNHISDEVMTGRIRFFYLPPDENSIYGQIEYNKEQGDKAPRRRPGDRYPIIGALTGIIAGLLLSFRTGNLFIIIICAIGGGIAGALIGSFIGYLVIKYQKSRRNRHTGERK